MLSGFAAGFRVVAAAGLLALAWPVDAAEPSGRVALISDIHLNPFDPPDLVGQLAGRPVAAWPAVFAAIDKQSMSPWGSDTNYALLSSSLAAFAKTAADSDFAIVLGDFLAHEFEAKAAKALGVAETDDQVGAFAVNTTMFVGDALARALSGKPVIVALGNIDSACGDYEITPGGRYLARTKDMVRRLAGADLVAPDFDQTYGAGGYYAVRHPQQPRTVILVINDILWSAKYRDACGSGGESAAEAMLDWLRAKLAGQRAAGGSVWLVQHIPWGIDSFATAHSKEAACEAKAVPLLREPYRTGFVELLRAYGDVVQASFASHIHTDDYRLLVDDKSHPVVAQKIVSAISPIYGQNPGYAIADYDAKKGAPTDFSTYYLANLDGASLAMPGMWRFEYTFSEAYDLPQYSAEAVATLAEAVATGGAAAETYRRLYQVGHGQLPEKDLTTYACAITRLDRDSFAKCNCGQ